MFWYSVRQTRFVPILALIVLLLTTLTEFILDAINGPDLRYYNNYGFFWDDLLQNILTPIAICLFAIIAAITLFRFVQSKKQSNVIFSLGLSRRKIFLAKYLGGIAPLAAALTFSAIVEILADLIAGYTVRFPTIHFALISVTALTAMYTLIYTIVAVTMAFSGNVVEAGIFSVIIAAFPNFSNIFFCRMRSVFTHGGTGTYDGLWSFFTPFYTLIYLPSNEGGGTSLLLDWQYGSSKLTVYDWSPSIMCLIFSAIIFAIAFLAFPKRKNEISGYFGKSKGLTEICGAMVGYYIGSLALYIDFGNNSNVEIISFVSFIMAFALAYLFFKFLFTHKRTKSMKQSAKRLAAYAAAFAVLTGIFSTGLFGYSTYIPDAEDVESINISLDVANPYVMSADPDPDRSDEVYGYTALTKKASSTSFDLFYLLLGMPMGYFDNLTAFCSVEDVSEIETVIGIHKELAREGKIKANADNACGSGFSISYSLRNGKTVERYYDTMSTENAAEVLGLSNFSYFKENLSNYFYYHGEASGLLSAPDYLDGFCIASKDLKSCKYVEKLDYDFINAVLADIEYHQDAQQIYFHKPEEELGVIYFPIRNTDLSSILNLYDNEVISDDGVIVNVDTDEITGTVQERRAGFPNNISDISLSLWGDKCIVVTKDMPNIIKYLTEHNLMQYFKSTVTADDVQKVKFATRAEASGKRNSDMLPLFAASYACADEVKTNDSMREQSNHSFAQHVRTVTEDKKVIQKVLDNALLYGFNDNSDRIVEVTYNDGSIATYAIKADVYNELNIN